VSVIFSCECECVFRRQVDIWFKPAERTDEEQLSADQQPQQHDAMIDRVSCLRPVLFDVFADHTTDPPMLNYQRMVIIHSRLLTTRLSYIWLQSVTEPGVWRWGVHENSDSPEAFHKRRMHEFANLD